MMAFKKGQAHYMRAAILNENKRIDGRTCDQIRPICVEQGILPRTHGSSLFTRGETQSIAVATLGGETMGLRYEDLDGENSRKFYLQYFFPPFLWERWVEWALRDVERSVMASSQKEPLLPPYLAKKHFLILYGLNLTSQSPTDHPRWPQYVAVA
jgi:hypothetical protein